MESTMTVIVNGKRVRVPAGSTVGDARQAVGANASDVFVGNGGRDSLSDSAPLKSGQRIGIVPPRIIKGAAYSVATHNGKRIHIPVASSMPRQEQLGFARPDADGPAGETRVSLAGFARWA